jgi:hypothetical protein
MRPNILLFGPFLAAWMLWVARRAGRLPRVPASWTALLCATLAVIAPVTTRNWLVSGEFVPVSTYFGQNLFIGNSAESDGFTPWTPYLQKLEGTGQFSVWVYNNIVRGLGREVGKENLTHSEASSIFARKALDHIRAHPGHALRLTLRKAVLFWSPREITGNKVVEQDRRHYPPLKYLPGFWLTGGLFLAGLLTLGWDRLRGRRCGDPELLALLLVFVLVYYVSFLPFFVNARARHPLAGLFLLLGAAALPAPWRPSGRAARGGPGAPRRHRGMPRPRRRRVDPLPARRRPLALRPGRLLADGGRDRQGRARGGGHAPGGLLALHALPAGTGLPRGGPAPLRRRACCRRPWTWTRPGSPPPTAKTSFSTPAPPSWPPETWTPRAPPLRRPCA